MGIVETYACYAYNQDWHLVDMVLNVSPSAIEWESFVVPDERTTMENWQVPYMEQYFNPEGSEKLCPVYDVPKDEMNPCRVVFFIYKTESSILSTPYGQFDLQASGEIPAGIKALVEFEE